MLSLDRGYDHRAWCNAKTGKSIKIGTGCAYGISVIFNLVKDCRGAQLLWILPGSAMYPQTVSGLHNATSYSSERLCIQSLGTQTIMYMYEMS